MKKLIAMDPRASRFTNDPVEPGGVFLPKDKRASKIVKALKWARDIEVETEVRTAPTASVSGSVADAAVSPEPEAKSESHEPEGDDATDEAETVAANDIEAARAEYERVTGEPADKRYGVARLREETAKHAACGRYQRRDMQAEDC